MRIQAYTDLKVGQVCHAIERETLKYLYFSVGKKHSQGVIKCHLGALNFNELYVFTEKSEAESYLIRLEDLKQRNEI